MEACEALLFHVSLLSQQPQLPQGVFLFGLRLPIEFFFGRSKKREGSLSEPSLTVYACLVGIFQPSFAAAECLFEGADFPLQVILFVYTQHFISLLRFFPLAAYSVCSLTCDMVPGVRVLGGRRSGLFPLRLCIYTSCCSLPF